jgi:gentisate 1,2-dioxygenase
MRDNLDAKNDDWSLQHYRSPTGDYISGTLGAHAELIRSGKTSPARQDTCSYIYHAHEGSGISEIVYANGERTTVTWQQNDTFAVPGWSEMVHTADESCDAYFFVLSDRPLLENLKMYFTKK